MTPDEKKITDWRCDLRIIYGDIAMRIQRETDKQKIDELETARKAAKQCFEALGRARWGGETLPGNAPTKCLTG